MDNFIDTGDFPAHEHNFGDMYADRPQKPAYGIIESAFVFYLLFCRSVFHDYAQKYQMAYLTHPAESSVRRMYTSLHRALIGKNQRSLL
jgi:hypothetical protein